MVGSISGSSNQVSVSEVMRQEQQKNLEQDIENSEKEQIKQAELDEKQRVEQNRAENSRLGTSVDINV